MKRSSGSGRRCFPIARPLAPIFVISAECRQQNFELGDFVPYTERVLDQHPFEVDRVVVVVNAVRRILILASRQVGNSEGLELVLTKLDTRAS